MSRNDSKHSLKFLEQHEDLAAKVTNQAFLFAQLTLAEAKKNSLTREQIIKEGCRGATRRIKNHRSGAR
ncbi:hypothetical protein [Salmonella phage vB_SenAt-pSL2]|nr:hypothetical protein [Salmonella phage vB_SenAt-pSL2]URG17652.1 hypothetical protein GRN51_360 [Salmonella phage GRNsp51]HBL6576687.1 hypothetical protein [Salmonella enterica subsp. enterica serovar Typhimurium]